LDSINQQNETSNSNEEIDFGPIYRLISRSIKSFFDGIKNYIVAMYKHKLKVILYCLVFAVIGYLISYSFKPVFKTEATYLARNVLSSLHHDKVYNINQLIEEENYNEVGQILNINPSSVEYLRQIKYKIEAKEYYDTSDTRQHFKVLVEVTDNSILDSLETALIGFLSDIDYVRKNRELYENKLNKLSQKVEDQIEELNELKGVVSESILKSGKGEGLVYGEPLDPVGIYEQELYLYKRLLNYEFGKKLIAPVELVLGFNHYKNPSFPNKIGFAIIGCLIGFVISSLLFGFKRIKD